MRDFDSNRIYEILGEEFKNIYIVDCKTQQIHAFKETDVLPGFSAHMLYNDAMNQYIDHCVYEKNRDMLRIALSFNSLYTRLENAEHFNIHYQSKTDSEIHFMYTHFGCIKDHDKITQIVIGFANEDLDIRRNNLDMINNVITPSGLRRKILIVEDNQGTNKAICEYMKEAGHTLFSAFTGSEALKIFREKELDIIVLDIMLPEMSGIVVLHEIRKISNIPVIMLTALDDEYTQSNSFDEMADDYITKPFSMLILGKRITALLRRSQNKPAVNMIKLGDVTVDFSGYTACDENGKIDITPKELEILKVLIDNKGLVLSRNQILDDVWGYDCDVIDRTIDAYIRNIRKKLRLDCITTVKGIGYKFEMGQEI